MQIMPGTATHTVKMFNIPGYSSPSQLLDPDTNINIGTSYLQYVYQQFGNNRIFSSAAYNAGPGRDAYLARQQRRTHRCRGVCGEHSVLETRGYVKNDAGRAMLYYRYFVRAEKMPDRAMPSGQRRY